MAELRDFGSDVACRFAGQRERALEYVNKSNDRFVNNARGLLTFNGLVLTVLGTVHRESHSFLTVTRFVINEKSNSLARVFSLVALLCLLSAFGIGVLHNHVY